MAKEFAQKTDSELLKELAAKREALRAFRFGISGSKVKNMKEGRNLKKEIALILTLLNSRQQEAIK